MCTIQLLLPFYGESRDINTLKHNLSQSIPSNYKWLIACKENDFSEIKKIISSIENTRIDIITTKKSLLVSNARNFLINSSSSDFISFVDSDDKVETSLFFQIHNHIRNNTEMLFIAPYEKNHNLNGVIKCTDLITNYLSNPYGTHIIHHVWSKFFSLSFLRKNNIYFDENKSIYEDLDFISKVIISLKRVNILPFSFYNHNKNSGALGKKIYYSPLGFFKSIENYSLYLKKNSINNFLSLKKYSFAYFFHKTNILLSRNMFYYHLYSLLLMLHNKDIFTSLKNNPSKRYGNIPKLLFYDPTRIFTSISYMILSRKSML